MPTYQYKCGNDHLYEEMRSFKEEQKNTHCPDCGLELKQIYSAPGVQLKGGGFYRNSR
jgi:putative FmdB family regulatory protein